MTTPLKVIDIPKEIYTDSQLCGEFIYELNVRLATLRSLEAVIKVAKAEAEDTMLQQLNASGQKNFNFEGLGIFKKLPQEFVNYPPEAEGGKAKAVAWLEDLAKKGVIDTSTFLYLQQNRLVKDAVAEVEAAAAAYNANQRLNGDVELAPSPFKRFTTIKLSSPKTRKA